MDAVMDPPIAPVAPRRSPPALDWRRTLTIRHTKALLDVFEQYFEGRIPSDRTTREGSPARREAIAFLRAMAGITIRVPSAETLDEFLLAEEPVDHCFVGRIMV